MVAYRKKSLWVTGIIFGISFATLFFIRLDLFGNIFSGPKTPPPSAVAALSERDTWMNIFQNENKIGFSHKIFSKEENGYRIQETVFMRINTMAWSRISSFIPTANSIRISVFQRLISKSTRAGSALRFRGRLTGTSSPLKPEAPVTPAILT